jgi:hypothetical protein
MTAAARASTSGRAGRVRAIQLHILTDAGLVVGGALMVAMVAIAQDYGGLKYDAQSYWLRLRVGTRPAGGGTQPVGGRAAAPIPASAAVAP